MSRKSVERIVTACLVVWAAVMFVALLAGCDDGDASAPWPESAEFSELETGQSRFSKHETGLSGWSVIVDHETGVQYLAYERYKRGSAVCPLLEADGTPMRVLEAGDDSGEVVK